MTVTEARKALDRELAILRTMEAVHCSLAARSSQSKDVARKIDALVLAARAEGADRENARLRVLGDKLLAEAKSATPDPKAGGHA